MFFSLHLQPSTLNHLEECCTWHGNVAPGSCDVAPEKRSKPFILLVCYNVAPGNAVFGGGRGEPRGNAAGILHGSHYIGERARGRLVAERPDRA
jgi:hypothetical protein